MTIEGIRLNIMLQTDGYYIETVNSTSKNMEYRDFKKLKSELNTQLAAILNSN